MRDTSPPSPLPSLKVLLVGNYAPDRQTSMLAFRDMLARELPPFGCEVRLSEPVPRLLRVPPTSRWWKWLGYLDKFVVYPPQLRRDARWADVVHICDHSNAMYVPRLRGRPLLLTCHDVIAIRAALGQLPGWSVRASGRVLQRLIRGGLRQAPAVACVSDATQRELLQLGLSEASRTQVIPNGLNADFSPLPSATVHAALARLGIDAAEPYLLHVGSDVPYKNRAAVLDAFIALCKRTGREGARAVGHLVFVGPPLSSAMAQTLEHSGLQARVRVLGPVGHDELRALYGGAAALLFPSLYEGFGWPIVEAQASGCPVITSNRAPMNEIGGNAAVYVPPDDPEAIADAVADALARRDEMVHAGLENASRYTPGRMAAAYAAAYKEAVRRQGQGGLHGEPQPT